MQLDTFCETHKHTHTSTYVCRRLFIQKHDQPCHRVHVLATHVCIFATQRTLVCAAHTMHTHMQMHACATTTKYNTHTLSPSLPTCDPAVHKHACTLFPNSSLGSGPHAHTIHACTHCSEFILGHSSLGTRPHTHTTHAPPALFTGQHPQPGFAAARLCCSPHRASPHRFCCVMCQLWQHHGTGQQHGLCHPA